MLDQYAGGYPEFAQGVNWLGTPLGWRAWVEQELTRITLLVHRRVAVTEHDYVGVGEKAPHPRGATCRRSTVMDHPDLQAAHLDHSAYRQHAHEGNVIVSEYGVDRRNLSQQVKDSRIKDVTGMQNGVRPTKALPRRLWQSGANPPVGAGGLQMSISQDYDSNAI